MTTTPEVGMGRLFRTASTAFNRVFRLQLAPQGITYGQFQYLQALWGADGLSQADLTRKVGVEMASSTAILDSLEERKLIRRIRNQVDRRKIYVYLTPKGSALKPKLMACAIATNAMARRGISNAEVLALFDIVGRIITNMNVPANDETEAKPRRALRRANRDGHHAVKPTKSSARAQL